MQHKEITDIILQRALGIEEWKGFERYSKEEIYPTECLNGATRKGDRGYSWTFYHSCRIHHHCKMFRRICISLGGVGLGQPANAVAALGFLSHEVWLKMCWKPDVARCWAPSAVRALTEVLSSHNSTGVTQTCRELPPLKNQVVGAGGTQQVLLWSVTLGIWQQNRIKALHTHPRASTCTHTDFATFLHRPLLKW